MITAAERARRAIMFSYALWEVRVELVERAERAVDREELSWFERERFDEAMDEHHAVLRRLEEFALQEAYDSKPVSVRCAPAERLETRCLALELFEGELSFENVADRLFDEGFPNGGPGPGDVGGATRAVDLSDHPPGESRDADL